MIKGTVVQVLDDEVMVDVGGKSEGVIPLRELSLKEAVLPVIWFRSGMKLKYWY